MRTQRYYIKVQYKGQPEPLGGVESKPTYDEAVTAAIKWCPKNHDTLVERVFVEKVTTEAIEVWSKRAPE